MISKDNGTTTLYEQIARQLLDEIRHGKYRRGDMLPSEKELILQTGVSRITVREALKTLAEMGVIETRKGKGSFVILDARSLADDRDDRSRKEQLRQAFIDSTKARLMLEPGIARAAAENSDTAELSALEAALNRRPGKPNPEKKFDEFHYALAMASHNPPVLSFMESLLKIEAQLGTEAREVLTVPEKQKGIAGELDRQHRKIFEAVLARDAESAEFYMREHMRFLLKSYEGFFGWFL